MTFALGAGKLFDVETSEKSEYVNTIIGMQWPEELIAIVRIRLSFPIQTAKCIDKYIALRTAFFDAQPLGGEDQIDGRLRTVVERMFKRCLDDKEFKQAIGIALESRRLDVVEAAIKQGNAAELLLYTLDVSMKLVLSLSFRNKVGATSE